MFECAIAWGHRPEAAGNPCKGIVRYRRPPRGRLLGADDLAKLDAVMNGESLHVAGRLLGHRRASTTNRYVHLDEATLSQAAERVALEVQRKLGQ